jgi:selenoprotein W-related protein
MPFRYPRIAIRPLYWVAIGRAGGTMIRKGPLIEIEYCTRCRWLLRAAWLAQELLITFEDDIGGVTLIPGQGGSFEIRFADGTPIWSRRGDGGFPPLTELKQRVRDVVAPDKPLGHSDRRSGPRTQDDG